MHTAPTACGQLMSKKQVKSRHLPLSFPLPSLVIKHEREAVQERRNVTPHHSQVVDPFLERQHLLSVRGARGLELRCDVLKRAFSRAFGNRKVRHLQNHSILLALTSPVLLLTSR